MHSNGKRFGKKLSGFLMTFLVFFSSVSVFPRKAQAKFDPFWVYKGGFNIAHMLLDKEYRENSIVKTALTAGTTFFTALPSHIVLGRNPDEFTSCALLIRDLDADGTLKDEAIPATLAYLDVNSANPADDKKLALEAAAIVATYTEGECNFNNTPISISKSTQRGSGTLLSMAVSLDNSVHREEIPVNLALFFQDYAQRIPVVKNTAFADTGDVYLGVHLVYDTWKLMRDISLGVMSLLLVVMGIMIMTRKKINPQAVVTVQNVLPRVAISVVLVFFSYAIGAFLIKLMWPLFDIIPRLVINAVAANAGALIPLPANPNQFSILGWSVLAVISTFTWTDVGMGMALILFSVILVIAIILVSFIVLVKIVIVYVKLLTYVIISPLYFTIGVIPGKESMIMDWFKEMFSGILSAAAMIGVLTFALVIPLISMGSSGSIMRGDSSISHFSGLFVPVIMLFVLFTAIKMPKKVSSWIKGDPKKH